MSVNMFHCSNTPGHASPKRAEGIDTAVHMCPADPNPTGNGLCNVPAIRGFIFLVLMTETGIEPLRPGSFRTPDHHTSSYVSSMTRTMQTLRNQKAPRPGKAPKSTSKAKKIGSLKPKIKKAVISASPAGVKKVRGAPKLRAFTAPKAKKVPKARKTTVSSPPKPAEAVL